MTAAASSSHSNGERGTRARVPRFVLTTLGWVAVSLAVSAGLLWLEWLGAFGGADLLLQNFLYRSQAPTQLPPVTVVAIDDRALAAVGKYPWPRADYVRFLDALHAPERLPAVVAFDVGFFDVTDEDPAPFATALRDFPRPVLLAAKAQSIRRTSPPQGARERLLTAPQVGVTPPEAEGYQQAQEPLRSANTTSAFANVIVDSDQRVRRVHAAVRADGVLVPSFSVAAVRAFLGVDDAREGLAIQDGRATVTTLQHRKLELGSVYAAIAPPVDRDGAFLINYIGGDESFPTVSMADVLDGTADPALLKDRIVLVGATTLDLHDIVSRPGTGAGQIPGVEVHAHAIATLLSRDFILPQDPRVTALLTVLVGLLSAFVAYHLRTARSFAAFLVLLALLPLGAALAFSLYVLGERSARLVSLTYPALSVGLSYVSVILLRITTEEREKRFLRRAFTQYVSPEVVAEIASDPSALKLGGARRQLTVLFSDIRGFTSISERMEAEDLVALLNEYFDIQTEIVLAERGVIDKFIGDAMMAFWGAPLAEPRQAELACRTALRMVETIAPFNAVIARRNLPPIAMGVGLNSGPAVVGNMGSSRRFDYTAMGDTVNLASRLEGLTKAYGVSVLVSQATREAAGPGFVFRTVDRVKVKGKKQAVSVSEIVALQQAGVPPPAWIARYEAGLALASERKWDAADAAFREALEAHPDDGPAQVMLARTAEWRKVPPPPDWDGSYAFDHK